MLLVWDCGNTQVVAGVYEGARLVCHWRLSSDGRRTEDEYMALLTSLLASQGLDWREIQEMAVCSVVPDVEWVLKQLARKHLRLEPLCLSSETDSGIAILLDNPSELGPDRIANAVAAHQLYGGELIVVDFGTATTFDCVTSQGEYLGGAIVPGIEISRQALFSRAARLSSIPVEKPRCAIGRSTAEGLQSGLMWGYGGQVDGLTRKLGAEMPGPPAVIATGGYAALIAPYSETIGRVEPMLTLDGLRLVYERVRG